MKENENGFVPFQDEEKPADQLTADFGTDVAPAADDMTSGFEESVPSPGGKRNFEKYLESDGQYQPQLGVDPAFEDKPFAQPQSTGYNAFENFQDPPRPVDVMAQMNAGSDPVYYQAPNSGPSPAFDGLEEPVSMGEWLVSMLLMLVPCVNIILVFVWAFSKTEKKSKSNYFKANLIMMGILFALYLIIILMAVFFGVAASL